MSKCRWPIVLGSMILLLGGETLAQETDDISALQQRIAALEQRVADLEKRLLAGARQPTPEQARAARRAMFNQRMTQDRKKYSDDQLREAEQLYQVANQDWRSPEAKQSLEAMVEKYPDVNRTGCAVLYLGQLSEGDEREEYLKRAIENHGDCIYGDGVIVGAYARFLLAQHYAAAGETEKAKELFNEIRQQYPDAIDHQQSPLAPQIEVYSSNL